MKPTKKKVIILIILAVAVFLGFYFFGKPKATPLQFATVQRQDIKATVSASGTLSGKDSANLRFRSSGRLAYINVKSGDRVTKGQVIAGLDTQDLNIALQQAQNTYRDKQAIAEKAEDEVKDHSKDESFTQKVTRTTAQAARDSAFDSVKAAQRAFQDAVITSPINGVITQAIEVPNQVVSSADLIAQVVDDSETYFDAEIDESDIAGVSVGQEAEVGLNTYPDKIFTGKVAEIKPSAKTTSSNATVIIVRILMDKSDIKNIPGLNGQGTITVAKAPNALSIPIESIQNDNTVAISGPKGITKLPITLGIKSDIDAEVKSGLSEGQQIILNPPAEK